MIAIAEALERLWAWIPIGYLIGFGAGALICGAAWTALSMVGAMRRTAGDVHKIHLQQENIVAMLLKAGFRPVRSQDWLEDGDRTSHIADGPAYTQYDLRKPE